MRKQLSFSTGYGLSMSVARFGEIPTFWGNFDHGLLRFLWKFFSLNLAFMLSQHAC